MDDAKFNRMIRPTFIELIKLEGPEEMDQAARRIFQRVEDEMRKKERAKLMAALKKKWEGVEKVQDKIAREQFGAEVNDVLEKIEEIKVDRKLFIENFDIDIEELPGFYYEVGGTETIQGPNFPISDLRNILVIRMSRTGKQFYPVVMKCDCQEGFITVNKKIAWVDVDSYEKMLNDDFFEKLTSTARKSEQRRTRWRKRRRAKALRDDKKREREDRERIDRLAKKK